MQLLEKGGLVKSLEIIIPAIPSAGVYFFTTQSGIEYEVRFGRKRNNVLHATIVFGVQNEEYSGEEYAETNRGEVYQVMSTLIKIIRLFMVEHPRVMIYEFTGTAKQNETNEGATTRSNLYTRYLPVVFPTSEGWDFTFSGSNVVVSKYN